MSSTLRIDTHVHLYRSPVAAAEDKEGYVIWEYGEGGAPKYSASLGSPEELACAMRQAEVSRVVVLNLFIAEWELRRFENALPSDLPDAERRARIDAYRRRLPEELYDFNRWGCEVARNYPSITPFVSVDLNVVSAADGLTMIRDLVENNGARGLKLHSAIHGHMMGDERLWPLYEYCAKHRLPVLGHAGLDTAGVGYCEPRAFAPVLEAFPELQVIVAHLGGGSWRQTAQLAERYPNAWFDCAEIIEWTDAGDAPSDTELAALIREVGAHRVLLGSDYPWYDLDRTIARVDELPLLSAEERELIIGQNALRLLDGRNA